MIGPVDYIINLEREARNLIEKGDKRSCKEKLDKIGDFIKGTEFLDGEIPDLLISIKKISSDYVRCNEYGPALEMLYFAYTKVRKINLINELKLILESASPDFNIHPYIGMIDEISHGNPEVLKIIEKFKGRNQGIDTAIKENDVTIEKKKKKDPDEDKLLIEAKEQVARGNYQAALHLLVEYTRGNSDNKDALTLLERVKKSIEEETENKIANMGITESIEKTIILKILRGNLKEADNELTGMLLNSRNPNLWLLKAYISKKMGNINYSNFIEYARRIDSNATESSLYYILFVKDLIL